MGILVHDNFPVQTTTGKEWRHGNSQRGAVAPTGPDARAGQWAGGRRRPGGSTAYSRGRQDHGTAPRTALHVAAPLRLSVAAARFVRRPRVSGRSGRAAEAHQTTSL